MVSSTERQRAAYANFKLTYKIAGRMEGGSGIPWETGGKGNTRPPQALPSRGEAPLLLIERARSACREAGIRGKAGALFAGKREKP